MNDQIKTLAVWDMENLHMAARQHHGGKGHAPFVKVREISEKLQHDYEGLHSVMVTNWSFLGFYNHAAVMSRSKQVHVAPSGGRTGTNSSDIALVIEVMEQVYAHPSIDKVVLLSGDSDFVPLVSWLQARRISVFVYSFSNSVSQVLSELADLYIPLETLYSTEAGKPAALETPDAAPSPTPGVMRQEITVAECGRVLRYLERVSKTPAAWLVSLLLRSTERRDSDRRWSEYFCGQLTQAGLSPVQVSMSAGKVLVKFCRRLDLITTVPDTSGLFHVDRSLADKDAHHSDAAIGTAVATVSGWLAEARSAQKEVPDA